MAVFATGDLFGWTEAQLLEGLRSAQAELASGAAIIQLQTGDVASQRAVQQNALQRISLFKRGLFELYLQDATTYAAYAGFSLEGQNTVLASFQ